MPKRPTSRGREKKKPPKGKGADQAVARLAERPQQRSRASKLDSRS